MIGEKQYSKRITKKTPNLIRTIGIQTHEVPNSLKSQTPKQIVLKFQITKNKGILKATKEKRFLTEELQVIGWTPDFSITTVGAIKLCNSIYQVLRENNC